MLLSPFFIFCIIFVKVFLRLKVLITLHNVTPHEKLFPTVEHIVFTISLRLADGLIVHNYFSKIMVQKLYNAESSKIWVIPHGNFMLYYPNNVSRRQAKELLGVPKKRNVFLFFGSVMRYKGIDLLLDAFERALQAQKGFFLIIAGSCKNRRLRNLVVTFHKRFPSDSLIKLRRIRDDEVQIFFKAADIGVIPYRELSTPGSMMLFMSFAKAIIVPKLQPILEMAHENFAFFFQPNDANSLEKALIKAAQSTTLTSMGKTAFEEAKKYDWKKIAEKTIVVYDAALHGKISSRHLWNKTEE